MTDPKDFPQPIVLLRECPAVRIPEGSELILAAGTEVYVTQALGGSVTVNVRGNLARISAANLDALGMAPTTPVPEHTAASQAGEVDVALVWEQLSTCYDPEIPINIVELGLIYRCEILPAEQGKRVEIDMTLTAAGCGMGPILVEDVRSKVAQVPNVSEVEVDLVFDPPWSQDMMSEAARLETGLY
jgi:probable FeS assembly SUF system protein SufT